MPKLRATKIKGSTVTFMSHSENEIAFFRDAAEYGDGVEHTRSAERSNSPGEVLNEQSGTQEETMTTDFSDVAANGDSELSESGDNESTSDNISASDHQYSRVNGIRQSKSVLLKIDADLSGSQSVVDDHRHSTTAVQVEKNLPTDVRSVCKACGLICFDSETLEAHIQKTHGEQNSAERAVGVSKRRMSRVSDKPVCDICGWVCKDNTATSMSFKVHMRRHTGEKPFTCELCSVAFRYRANLKRHMILHADVQRFLCQYCARSFQQNQSLLNHIAKHHHTIKGDPDSADEVHRKGIRAARAARCKSTLCELCGKSYSCSAALQVHKCSGGGVFGGNAGREAFMARAFGCNVCNMAYTSASKLYRHVPSHIIDHHGPVLAYKCQLCDEQFELMVALTSHLTGVHGVVQPPHQCSECYEAFYYESLLKQHMRVHGDDAFTCTVCAKKFGFHGSLKQHMAVHTGGKTRGNKEFSCFTCGKCFSLKSMLTAHERIHSGEKPFVCNTCGRAFRQQIHLIQHIRTHTKAKPYQCSWCSKAYRLRNDLRCHCSRVHNVDITVQPRKRT